MKKAIAILMSLIFIFAISAISFAAEKAARRQVTGEVLAVDAKADTLTVKGRKGDVTVSVVDKTKITAEEIKTLADVKVGDKVTLIYKATDDKNTAKSIAIKAAPAKISPGY